jgi:pyruvate-formate lyase-activating enzyme
MPPRLLYADARGNIFDHPKLFLAGSQAGVWRPVADMDCIPLPEGSEVFLLPGRLPVARDGEGGFTVLSRDQVDGGPVSAVAAFMAPAHASLFSAAYATQPGAPRLPLFAYTALGFSRGKMVAAGIRVDPDPRQDQAAFNHPRRIESSARKLLKRFPHNRLARHLAACALTSCCPAARNLMLGRWEAPLPVAEACNARCLGCISFQPEGIVSPTQQRIAFTPSAEEVAEIGCFHLGNARQAMVSFGQGCEGEPLTNDQLLLESIRLMRGRFPRATINLNSNGSRPEVMEALMAAGLSSARISLNSLLPERHAAYYRPSGWSLEDALACLKTVKAKGGFTSLNLLSLPGVNDQEQEIRALIRIIENGWVDFIQWRNLNIDPEYYLQTLDIKAGEDAPRSLGIAELITALKRRFPNLGHGYFNPRLEGRANPLSPAVPSGRGRGGKNFTLEKR